MNRGRGSSRVSRDSYVTSGSRSGRVVSRDSCITSGSRGGRVSRDSCMTSGIRNGSFRRCPLSSKPRGHTAERRRRALSGPPLRFPGRNHHHRRCLSLALAFGCGCQAVVLVTQALIRHQGILRILEQIFVRSRGPGQRKGLLCIFKHLEVCVLRASLAARRGRVCQLPRSSRA